MKKTLLLLVISLYLLLNSFAEYTVCEAKARIYIAKERFFQALDKASKALRDVEVENLKFMNQCTELLSKAKNSTLAAEKEQLLNKIDEQFAKTQERLKRIREYKEQPKPNYDKIRKDMIDKFEEYEKVEDEYNELLWKVREYEYKDMTSKTQKQVYSTTEKDQLLDKLDAKFKLLEEKRKEITQYLKQATDEINLRLKETLKSFDN